MSTDAPPRRVLVSLIIPPTGTPESREAVADRECLSEALWYATATGASLMLLHVLEEESFSANPSEAEVETERQRCEAAMAQYVQVAAAAGVSAECAIAAGFPWLEMLRIARRWGAELVITGSRRRANRFFVNPIYGSNARRLARKSEIPVWVVARTGIPPVTAIAVPVDMGAVTPKLLAAANALHDAFSVDLHLLHCVPFSEAYYSMVRGSPERLKVEAHRHEAFEKIEARLGEMLGPARDNWTFHFTEGPVVGDLARLIEREHIDLVMMGTVSRTGIPGLIIGNTAERVLARIECPLWVMKPDGWKSQVTEFPPESAMPTVPRE